MLFIFLLDNDELMNEIKFPSSFSNGNKESSPNYFDPSFLPTSMDASLYFIQQYSKLVNDKFSAQRISDEGIADKEFSKASGSNEHRFILFTFNEMEKLHLRHSWKDSLSNLHEELKNISFENRNIFKARRNSVKNDYLNFIGDNLEDFMKKFEASYFNCTHLTGGHFNLKESENVFVFALSSQKWKLEKLSQSLLLGWQRKNIFIQLHPESYEGYQNRESDREMSDFNYFPVTNLRDSDQLARTLFHANVYNSFETQNMELLGKGGLVDFIANNNEVADLGILQPNFAGKPKWPVPNTLTDDSWSNIKPKFILNQLNESDFEQIPKISFDEYFAFCPRIREYFSFKNIKRFTISMNCQLGPIPIGYGELLQSPENSQLVIPLIKIFIGPFNIFQVTRVLNGSELFSKYLQNTPQFYEYYFYFNLGERKWNEFLRFSDGNSRKNEFPLPVGLVENKNYFKSTWRQKSKNELALLVERAENSHKLRTSKRNSSYHPVIFPSLGHIQNDSGNLCRLQSRFKNSLSVFLASCDPKIGCSSAFGEFQLPQVIFKHSQSVHQMTDFSERLHSKRSLRPLFNENERDLFEILKLMPSLSEEMGTAQFISGDIFGNPYKKDKKMKEPSLMESRRTASNCNNPAFISSNIKDESSEGIVFEGSQLPNIDESLESIIPSGLMSPMSIDEIDYKEMEDLETEIVVNGSIVNFPLSTCNTNNNNTECLHQFDIKEVEKWIKSPGGLEYKTKLIETLPVISDLSDLESLLSLSKRFKRVTLTSLINNRIGNL